MADSTTAPPRLLHGSDAFDGIVEDILKGEADKLYNCGEALPGIEIGPGLLTLLGAPPGRGKTALAMQATYEAVKHEPGLRAVVASLEVSEKTLIKRRLAKEIGVTFEAIRFNRLTAVQRKQIAELTAFRQVLNSIYFVSESKCGLGDLQKLLTSETKPGLLVLDYIQLFGSDSDDAKVRAAQTMATARLFCSAGWAVVAVSALSRGRGTGRGGRSQVVDLDSFRDSSAIEYSGAAAYSLDETEKFDPSDPPPIRRMRLRCLKNRNGEQKHIDLLFNGPQMSFGPVEPVVTDTMSAQSKRIVIEEGMF